MAIMTPEPSPSERDGGISRPLQLLLVFKVPHFRPDRVAECRRRYLPSRIRARRPARWRRLRLLALIVQAGVVECTPRHLGLPTDRSESRPTRARHSRSMTPPTNRTRPW